MRCEYELILEKGIEPFTNISLKIFPKLAMSGLLGSCHSSLLPFADSNENSIHKQILIGLDSNNRVLKRQSQFKCS